MLHDKIERQKQPNISVTERNQNLTCIRKQAETYCAQTQVQNKGDLSTHQNMTHLVYIRNNCHSNKSIQIHRLKIE